MALLKFELTEKHIALGKHVNLKDYFESRLNPNQKAVKALIYDEFGLILYGRPEGEFDPMSDEDIAWSAEQKDEMDTRRNIMILTGKKVKNNDNNC